MGVVEEDEDEGEGTVGRCGSLLVDFLLLPRFKLLRLRGSRARKCCEAVVVVGVVVIFVADDVVVGLVLIMFRIDA